MFGQSNRRRGRAARPGGRFIPRLEALDGRILPGGVSGGVLGDTRDLTALRDVSGGHIESGARTQVSPMHIGEEIPQVFAR
jgi:hypothetical protein